MTPGILDYRGQEIIKMKKHLRVGGRYFYFFKQSNPSITNSSNSFGVHFSIVFWKRFISFCICLSNLIANFCSLLYFFHSSISLAQVLSRPLAINSFITNLIISCFAYFMPRAKTNLSTARLFHRAVSLKGIHQVDTF